VHRLHRFVTVAALGAATVLAGCHDYLTGGELSNDPNRPSSATADRLFVGVMSNIWAMYGSDPARLGGIFTQQLLGTNGQYSTLSISLTTNEQTTNGFFTTVYAGGGLTDIHREQQLVKAANDSLWLGISQVQEGLLMGAAADLFGDVVYSQAYSGPNPKLDPQMQVYDSLQNLLSAAIRNMAATGRTNLGPGGADIIFGGDPDAWTRVAHTLKARLYLHTAEVRPTAYQSALAESRLGIQDPSGSLIMRFSGNSGEQNFWYQFDVVNRPGYMTPNPAFVELLQQRNDPRLDVYFNADQSDLSDAFVDPTRSQPIITAQENLLIEAESAYRTGNQGLALTALNEEQDIEGVALTPASTTGPALLREILTEKFIALFGQIEPWNDYKRTCFPNIAPPESARGRKFPARLLYDANERQTNTNIPGAEAQPFRNANDPANATDPFGNVCLGQ
jgi:starch-binding outer membrane protein, SusD/RagB family